MRISLRARDIGDAGVHVECAVHHLDRALRLRPTSVEVRQQLDESRRRGRGVILPPQT